MIYVRKLFTQDLRDGKQIAFPKEPSHNFLNFHYEINESPRQVSFVFNAEGSSFQQYNGRIINTRLYSAGSESRIDGEVKAFLRDELSASVDDIVVFRNKDSKHKEFEFFFIKKTSPTYQLFLSVTNSANHTVIKSQEQTSAVQDPGVNIIYFGAPGTGKSYKIKHEVIPDGVTPYRVTFYSDYYYSDFVGGLRPRTNNGAIEYKFEAGPFARALRDSFKKGEPVYIIIEEINRGNAAAIFGDLFQLLDRKEGKSEYSISNHDLYQYLVDEGVTCLKEDQVYIPSNLNILCTMNTADQNVFVLDTAFKRRFRMEYVPIDFSSYYTDHTEENGVKDECKGYLDNTSIFVDASYSDNLKEIMGGEVYERVSKVISSPSRNWPTFAAFVNAKIDVINAVEQKISEDKKLGPFFVDVDELIDKKAFADKVIYYLKQDVFKYEDNILDESYDILYDDFVNNGKDIFLLFEPHK